MSEAHLFVATTFTETYERVLVGPLFRPFAEQLVARLAPHRGDSVIDIACGTGIVARVARERLGPDARIVDSRHSFGDAEALKQVLADAGFRDVHLGTLAHDVRFADGARKALARG